MEEEQKEETSTASAPTERMFFEQPTSLKTSGGGGKKVVIPIVLFILLILGAGGWFLTKGSGSSSNEEPTSSPSFTISPETPSPAPSVDRSEIKIEILNGTGITGEASFLQDKLKALGYSDFKVGNAQNQDQENAQVLFSSDVPQELQDEIETKLREIYTKVEVSTKAKGDIDVSIITGLKKGVTPKPSPTKTPTATSSPSPSPTATPTPTP